MRLPGARRNLRGPRQIRKKLFELLLLLAFTDILVRTALAAEFLRPPEHANGLANKAKRFLAVQASIHARLLCRQEPSCRKLRAIELAGCRAPCDNMVIPGPPPAVAACAMMRPLTTSPICGIETMRMSRKKKA